jgi:branched-chain amino acid aminotransferase
MAQPKQHPGFVNMLDISQNGFLNTNWKNQMLEREVDSLFFSNEKNQLLETTQSQIFLIKGSKIFTPDSAVINKWGIENSIEKAASEIGLGFSRTSSIQIEHLYQADELFLANDFDGICWVVGYGEKRFFKKYSPLLLDRINKDWENSN